MKYSPKSAKVKQIRFSLSPDMERAFSPEMMMTKCWCQILGKKLHQILDNWINIGLNIRLNIGLIVGRLLDKLLD